MSSESVRGEAVAKLFSLRKLKGHSAYELPKTGIWQNTLIEPVFRNMR